LIAREDGAAVAARAGPDRHGKDPVLTLTPSAESAIRDILEASPLPEGAGVRISADEAIGGEVGFRLALVGAPEPGDRHVEKAGVPVYLEPQVAPLLDDGVLDATAQADRVTFTVGPKAP
jgi:Fe-S cluster assembly iron-binding protein IscA